jgi:hypothetical protein
MAQRALLLCSDSFHAEGYWLLRSRGFEGLGRVPSTVCRVPCGVGGRLHWLLGKSRDWRLGASAANPIARVGWLPTGYSSRFCGFLHLHVQSCNSCGSPVSTMPSHAKFLDRPSEKRGTSQLTIPTPVPSPPPPTKCLLSSALAHLRESQSVYLSICPSLIFFLYL